MSEVSTWIGSQLMADFNFTSKYALYNKSKKRRETWEESVERMRDMHLRKYIDENWQNVDSKFKNDIIKAFDLVKDKCILGSQRALQFGGKGVEKHNARLYNCTFTHIDRVKSFAETLYLLLCGCGVGFSVQKRHINRLPDLISTEDVLDKKPKVHKAKDSIEGWADCLDVLMQSYFRGFRNNKYEIVFDLSKIRPKGSELSTGGKAPGPEPLKKALDYVKLILDQAIESGQEKLKPIQAHDIICHSSDAVLAGGVRRSACISLFDFDDEEMILCKTGNWNIDNPQRARANNSAVLNRNLPEDLLLKQFKKIMKACREFGEPGFYFVEHEDYGTNPCAEISLFPIWIGKEYKQISPSDIDQQLSYYDKIKHPDNENLYLYKCGDKFYTQVDNVGLDLLRNKEEYEKNGYTFESGFSFCNLTEINAKKITSKKKFKNFVWAATLVGTLQAGYTDFSKYLTPVSEWIVEREALLGVSMTGIMDSPKYALNKEMQEEMAKYAISVNKKYSNMIGINQAARVTCVKPAGNSSVILETSSGIHPHHAKRFIRRVQANKIDNVYKWFKEHNPHLCDESVWSANDSDDVISFPIEIQNGSITKQDVGAIGLLSKVLSTQRNWVINGTARPESCEGLHHNVSNTIHVPSDKWMDVGVFIFENRNYFSGISILGESGDKALPQMPMERIWFKDELIEKYGYQRYCYAKYLHDRIIQKQNNEDVKKLKELEKTLKLNKDNDMPDEVVQILNSKIQKLKRKTHSIYSYIYPVVALYNGCENLKENGITEEHYQVFMESKTLFNGWDDGDAIMNLVACIYDEQKWNELLQNLEHVDYTKLTEEKDNTKIQDTVACAGGACELI